MAEKLKIWFDAEADFLEVRFSPMPLDIFAKHQTSTSWSGSMSRAIFWDLQWKG